MTFYRMHDAPESTKAAIVVEKSDAKNWNTPEKGFGIFMTVNEFDGARRKECLRKINAWAVDMDDGTKQEQHDRLLKSPLIPSLIVETKRGYQAYWIAKDGKAEHWNAIVLERLVPFFGADNNARDLCRILRVPGFLHLKNPAEPFLVRTVWQNHNAYRERDIAQAFKWIPNKQEHDRALAEAKRTLDIEARDKARQSAIAQGHIPTETLWEAIWALDCEEALRRLSGHWAVGGEQYTFRSTSRGNLNVFVDGKSSSVFIDENKRIGSLDGGGPTIVQWLRWFKHDWKTVLTVIKETFPQLAEIDEAAKKAWRS